MRKLLAASLTAALAFLGSAAIAAPAAHAEACTYRFSADVDSGVSTAWADFYSCQDGYGSWWTVTGRLYDTACDNRTAYLDIHAEGSGGATRSVSGCGNSRYYSVSFPTPVWGFKLRTRACNTTCSNEDSIWVYP